MSRTKKSPQISPEQLAVSCVEAAFAEVRETPATTENLFDDCIGEVVEALIKQHERERGVKVNDGDTLLFDQKAGYLVGVQVGLRLRGVR